MQPHDRPCGGQETNQALDRPKLLFADFCPLQDFLSFPSSAVSQVGRSLGHLFAPG